MRRGLKVRLTLSVAIVALLTIAMLTLGFNVLLRNSLHGDADRVLKARAAAAVETVRVEHGQVSAPAAPDESAPDAGVWVYGNGGRLIEGPPASTAANALATQLSHGPGSSTLESTSEDIKLLSTPVMTTAGAPAGTVIASLSVEPYEQSANHALVGSIAFAAIFFLLVVGVTWIVVGRALRPVARMTSEAADWSEHDLDHRFNLGPPHDELTHLAATFDSMLAQLAAALRRERRLTAEISHELRTPLSAVSAEAELALRRPRADEEYRQAIAQIKKRADELEEIIDALLTSARGEGQAQTDSTEAAAIAARAIESGGGGVEVRAPDGPARVQAGIAAGSQVLSPLLENARRYGTPPIQLTIARENGDIIFTLEDCGIGIAREDLEHAFEPGWRGNRGRADGGAGLGLALSRRMARALGGDVIAVESDSGAVLQARLPASTGV